MVQRGQKKRELKAGMQRLLRRRRSAAKASAFAVLTSMETSVVRLNDAAVVDGAIIAAVGRLL